MCKMCKSWKRDHFLPLRMRGSFFGLKTGSRGTPWNSKSAQPGGSDFTKCRFYPFKWHFGVFEGGRFLTLFLINFCVFSFVIFLTFVILHFVTFLTFSILLIFTVFWVLSFLSIFMFFSCFDLFFSFWKGILKIRPSFDPFCPPSSTPMASTLGGSFLNGKKCLFFFLSFLKMSLFSLNFDQFWSFFPICH